MNDVPVQTIQTIQATQAIDTAQKAQEPTLQPDIELENITIIGSGPAGLTAAIYAARALLSPLVIDAMPGGQLLTTNEVDNFPGFKDGVMGPVLMEDMHAQAERFGARFLQEPVESVDLSAYPYTIKTAQKQFKTRSIIIATGARPRMLGLPEERRLVGRGVSVCATCDAFFYRGKATVIAGGGDTAYGEALHLSKFASSVTVINRASRARASAIMIEKVLSTENTTVRHNTVIAAIREDEKSGVTGVRLKDLVTGEEEELPAEGLFIAIGHEPNSALFAGQLQSGEEGYLIADGIKTSVPGVFAAGDVKDERYRQAVVAAADGCKAALEAQWFIENGALEERGPTQALSTDLPVKPEPRSLPARLRRLFETISRRLWHWLPV